MVPLPAQGGHIDALCTSTPNPVPLHVVHRMVFRPLHKAHADAVEEFEKFGSGFDKSTTGRCFGVAEVSMPRVWRDSKVSSFARNVTMPPECVNVMEAALFLLIRITSYFRPSTDSTTVLGGNCSTA